MKIELVNEHKTNGKLLCLAVNDNFVYTGGTSKVLYKYTHDLKEEKILCEHEKSIRCVQTKGNLVICGSFDGNATVLHNDLVHETIEGPETEIKGVDLENENIHNNRIGLCSRGKTTWILKFDQKIEIESVLEDHTQDIKGIKFIGDLIYTYGYDNTIKIYKKFTSYDDTWVLIQSIDDLTTTVWDILVAEKLFAACHDGTIGIFSKKEKTWEFEKIIKLTDFPIYSLCRIEKYIAVPIDLFDFAIFDLEFNLLFHHKNTDCSEINSIKFNETSSLLFTCDDGGYIRSYKLLNE